jgi:hypothetical protein
VGHRRAEGALRGARLPRRGHGSRLRQHRPHPRRRNATLAAEAAARDALKTNAAGAKGKSARTGIVRAQRADYFENNLGRLISIEAQVLMSQSELIVCTNPTGGTGCS